MGLRGSYRTVPPNPVASSAALSVSRRHRPLAPVIHSEKAFGVTSVVSRDNRTPVRDFFALAHRGHNPNDSDFHLQARIGFTRPRPTRVRLRPLKEKIVV